MKRQKAIKQTDSKKSLWGMIDFVGMYGWHFLKNQYI